MSVPAIRLDALSKYYGPVIGIDGLTLDVEPGEVFGFLGANGAGKTTTIRILLDLLRPSGGSAAVLGFDTQKQSLDARRRIGYLPGETPIYPELSGAGYLTYLGKLGASAVSQHRLSELLRRFDISDLDLTRRMRDYSHGMKRKLGIVQALMTEAPVIILDEPTSGLDPLMIEAFSETVDELASGGRTTVFLSSHILAEVERVCARVALVRAGRLLAVRSIRSADAPSSRRVTITFSRPVGASPNGAGTVVVHEPQRWIVDVDGPLGALVSQLAHLPVHDVVVSSFTLEDTVLRLMAEDQGR